MCVDLIVRFVLMFWRYRTIPWIRASDGVEAGES